MRRLTVKVIHSGTPLSLRLALGVGGVSRTAQLAVAR
jgi:hypothetical protein